MPPRGYVFAGIAGESLSNRTTSKLGTGLFRARIEQLDAGLDAWEDLSPRLCAAPEVRAIVASPHEAGTLYVGTQLGVHRTRDSGESWQLLAAPRPEFGVWSLAVSAERVIAGYDPNQIHVSTDGGETWAAANMPTSYPAGTAHEVKRVMGLAFDPADRRRIYATVEVGGVLRSDDGGRSFTIATLHEDVDTQDLHAVAVGQAGVLAVGRDGIFRSADRGRSFALAVDDSLWLSGITPAALEAIVDEVSRARFAGNLCVRRLATEGAGVRIALGARWSSRADYGAAFDARAIGARRNGEGRERPAACWHAVAAVLDACYREHATLVVETAFARFEHAAAFRARAGAIAAAPCDCNAAGGGAHGGELRAALDWLMVEQYCRSITTAAITTTGPDTVYVGAGASWLAEHGTIYRSRDGGRSFRPLALPDRIASTVFGVAVAPSDHRRIAAATKEGQVLLSADAGDSWQVSSLPANANPVYALCVT